MLEYQYVPLDVDTGELRLLELHPGCHDDPVKITIFSVAFSVPEPTEHRRKTKEEIQASVPAAWSVMETLENRIIFVDDLDQSTTWDHPDPEYDRKNYEAAVEPRLAEFEPKYEALSYTWGSPENQAALEVGLEDCTSELHVGSNLANALRDLRRRIESRILWVDAICINQKDLVERGQQVARMGSIYTYAQRVVVWLGPSSHDSSLAFSSLQHLGKQFELTICNNWVRAPNATEVHWKARDVNEWPIDEATWQSVCNLILRPWFGRLWIIQEIQLANRVSILQCGSDEISWYHLRRALLRCAAFTRHDCSQTAQSRLVYLSNMAKHLKNEPPLRLFELARTSECSDPRDRIYALLGLLPDTLSKQICPQYAAPTKEIYKQTFLTYAEWSGSLEPLCSAGPSWVPDWSILGLSEKFLLQNTNASSHSTAEFVHVSSDILEVTGVLFDTVVDIRGPIPKDPYEVLCMAYGFWFTNKRPAPLYPTGESLAQACAWTLACGFFCDKWINYAGIAHSLEDAQKPFQQLQEATDEEGYSFDQYLREFSFRFPFIMNAIGKTMFRTSKGYFGVVSAEVLPGDKVCILLGCPMPAILRKERSEEYTFIRCAHIHGLMEGEALLGPLPENWTVIMEQDQHGHARPVYIHSTARKGTSFRHRRNETRTFNDPRIGPLSPQWTLASSVSVPWTYRTQDQYENQTTGRIVHSDPRLLPRALKARGIKLEKFLMI
ncbi:heterokaryon incompatibility protein-domain-containing protein [Pyrenochaeta sp. MPI-SDFR-AT-0127]|nr:heterokaryon incompatibility protein-domain-containing protein [Pyrenochaeta sp. MPI-SDFR-AT-0127]